MTANLETILNILKAQVKNNDCSYYIPEAWNSCGFQAYTTTAHRPGELLVNPYAYMLHCIENGILTEADPNNNEDSGSCLTGGVMYGMLPRMFTAWHHGEDGSFSQGTFLKAITLIPYLKRMNAGIIYLLPVFKYSDRYRKGAIGSPYAIKNIYKLDENLHDRLLGDYSEELLNTEFKAFIEAFHLSGIKVMLDFVFRTVARDNDLIMEHPDWFYWIDAKARESFHIPHIENEKEHAAISERSLANIYSSSGIKEYLASFRLSPGIQDPARWTEVLNQCRQCQGNILDYVEESFGMTTAPGFSDVINDNQPPWTDATYLRFYFDVHEKAQEYISPEQVPYILQDGAKLSLFRGNEKNEELWEYVAGVIPYYQNNFGIDGARIDMGHALPPELNSEIISRVRQQDPGFILWSEEFNVKNSGRVKNEGFDFITSSVWYLYKSIGRPGFQRTLADNLLKSEVPVTGALETPDTPRSACYYRDKGLLRLLVWVNCFIPNAVLFINNGQELVEIQPMNLGMDNTEEGRFMLEKEDPMYGRLAFFDDYCLHWLSSDREWMIRLLEEATDLRKSFEELISDKRNFIEQPALKRRQKLMLMGYYDKRSKNNIFIAANSSAKTENTFIPEEILPAGLSMEFKECRLLHRETSEYRPVGLKDKLRLKPYEVVIMQFA